jgi:hypothetical protein
MILYGGLSRIANSATHFMPVNVVLFKSKAWLQGTLFINKKPYYRLLPYKDNYIYICTNLKKHNYLMVNDKIIYEHPEIFDYMIKVNLATDKPLPVDFYKYY